MSEGTLGIKLKPIAGDKSTPKGVFCAEILNQEMGIPSWVTEEGYHIIHEAHYVWLCALQMPPLKMFSNQLKAYGGH